MNLINLVIFKFNYFVLISFVVPEDPFKPWELKIGLIYFNQLYQFQRFRRFSSVDTMVHQAFTILDRQLTGKAGT